MKKKTMGSLVLNRETIRQLAADELVAAAGGVTGNMSICVCPSKPTNCTQALACQSGTCP